jgi:hypothetical protein
VVSRSLGRIFLAPLGGPVPIGWSCHAYSQFLVKNASDKGEKSWAFGYRRTQSETGLSGISLILTEGGQDTERTWRDLISSEPRCNGQWGWQCRGASAEDYMDWLAWFDNQLQAESDVLGVTLFQLPKAPTGGTLVSVIRVWTPC